MSDRRQGSTSKQPEPVGHMNLSKPLTTDISQGSTSHPIAPVGVQSRHFSGKDTGTALSPQQLEKQKKRLQRKELLSLLSSVHELTPRTDSPKLPSLENDSAKCEVRQIYPIIDEYALFRLLKPSANQLWVASQDGRLFITATKVKDDKEVSHEVFSKYFAEEGEKEIVVVAAGKAKVIGGPDEAFLLDLNCESPYYQTDENSTHIGKKIFEAANFSWLGDPPRFTELIQQATESREKKTFKDLNPANLAVERKNAKKQNRQDGK